MRKVRMYNVYFGDCFQIQDSYGSLVVDFGMHTSSKLPGKGKADILYYKICEELKKLPLEREVLVTHFHQDHISGLMKLMKNWRRYPPPFFQKAYIPDIFTPSVESTVSDWLVRYLLDELISGFYFPNYKLNLCEFCKFLCGGTKYLQLLKRGNLFRKEEYIVLWPDPETLKDKEYKKLLGALKESHQEFYNEINEVAEGITEIIKLKEKYGGNQYSRLELETLEKQIDDLLKKYRVDYQLEDDWEIFDQITKYIFAVLKQLNHRMQKLQNILNNVLENKEQEIIKASNVDNWASIVFHNVQDDNSNLLFTGDIVREYMEKIAEGKTAPFLHETYRFIKVPHHGTNKFYFDFSKFSPTFLMIPNGQCCSKGYQISKEYALKCGCSSIMFCSNCNWCPNWNPVEKCKCTSPHIIYRHDFSSPGFWVEE